jgi:hypothetical protein
VKKVQEAVEENRALFGTIDSWLIWVRLNVMYAEKCFGGYFLTILFSTNILDFYSASLLGKTTSNGSRMAQRPFEKYLYLLLFYFSCLI